MKSLLLALALLGPIERLDQAARRDTQSLRRPGLDRAMQAVSGIGRPAIVLGGLLAIAILDETAGVATARLALATLAPVNLLVEGIKWSVDRARPSA